MDTESRYFILEGTSLISSWDTPTIDSNNLLGFDLQLHSSRSREMKAILDEMNLSPPPTIFDVDQRGSSL